MKKLLGLALLSLLLVSCQTFLKDQAIAPNELNQYRLLIKIDDKIESGIHGTINPDKIYIRSYNKGSVIIRGYDDCSYITSKSFSDFGWQEIDISDFPNKDSCIFTIQMNTKEFDAPMMGKIIVKRFKNPNILPLGITVNKIYREGVNFIQIAARNTKNKSGISESNDLIIKTDEHTGELIIDNTCGMPQISIPYSGEKDLSISLNDLYYSKESIDQDCNFVFTAIHDDYIAQMAMVLVSVYNGFGSWLSAPIFKDGCFEFTDKFVAGSLVNNKKNKCDKDNNKWVVEGITSKHRMFYGEFENGQWKVMK